MQYRKDSVYDQILKSALGEFDEKGYEAASIRNIAKQAGTSVGNLYRYFRGKEALYASCLSGVLDECIDWTGDVFDISSHEAICFTAERISEYVGQHSREFRIVTQGPAAFYASFLDRYAACIVRQLHHSVGQAQGDHDPLFLETIAHAFIGGMRQIMEDHDHPDDRGRFLLEFMVFLFEDFKDRMNGTSRMKQGTYGDGEN